MSEVAMELLSYQRQDKFPDELTKVITILHDEYHKVNGKMKRNSPIVLSVATQIEKLIKARTNMTVIFDHTFSANYPAAIIPFSKDYLLSNSDLSGFTPSSLSSGVNSSVFLGKLKEIDREVKEYSKRIHKRKGFVSYKLVRVDGYLADLRHHLIINFPVLFSAGLTPREVSAIILHELGHAFYGITHHYRLHTTNMAILDVMEEINNNRPDKVMYTYKRYFDNTDLVEASITKDSDVTDFYGPLVKRYIKELSSSINDPKYDETSSEYLADSFSTKFGLGKDAVSGLNKINQLTGQVIYDSSVAYNKLYWAEALGVCIGLGVTGALGGALFAVGVGVVSSTKILLTRGTSNTDYTYDKPIERYTRIKNTLITELKRENLPDVYASGILEQISFIDNIISKTNNLDRFFDQVVDFIIPSANKSKYYTELQQLIENSLNNKLFVSSAQLKYL